MFHADLQHTGTTSEIVTPPLTLLWSYPTGSAVESSPAVSGGIVYIGSGDGNVYALDAITGAFKWSYTTGGAVYSSPAVSGGIVYIGSGDGKVYALDASTGSFKWSYTTGGAVYSSPAVSGGIVYIGSDDSKVYAFKGTTPPPPVGGVLTSTSKLMILAPYIVLVGLAGTVAVVFATKKRHRS